MDRPEAGWYPDPAQPGRVRYFDGDDWTDHTRDSAPSQPIDGGPPPGEVPHATDRTVTTEPPPPAAPGEAAPDGHGKQSKGSRGMVLILAVVVLVLVVAGSVYLGSLVGGDEPGVAGLADREQEAEADDVTDPEDPAEPGDALEDDDGAEDGADADDPGPAEDTDAPDPDEDTEGPDPGDGSSEPGAAGAREPAERDGMYERPFERTIDPAASYLATIVTPYGDIEVELDPAGAPLATNNLVNLADEGFYDGVTFHRVIEGFVIQGGDPSGTGAGGPGYRFEDELETAERLVDDEGGYPRGTLAMANAGPDTNGSQFFIVHGELIDLAPAYTVFGTVVDGIEVVDAIAGLSTDAADRPVATATITTVDITEQ